MRPQDRFADARHAKAFRDLNQAVALERNGLWAEADRAYARMIKKNPQYFDGLHFYGLFKFKKGQLSDALGLIEKAHKLFPHSLTALNSLGVVYAHLKNYEGALQTFNKIIERDKNNVQALGNKAQCLNELGRFQETIDLCDKILALDKFTLDAYIARGTALLQLNVHEEALSDYQKAVGLNQSCEMGWYGIGNVLYHLKRYNEAISAFNKALSIKPDLVEALFGSGSAFVELNRHKEALIAFDRAVAIKPDLEYAIGYRLHCKLNLSDWINLDEETADLVARVRERKPAAHPFMFLAISTSAADQLKCAETFMANHHSFPAIWHGEIYSHDRIRIGYLSADFHTHATAQLVVGLFEYHDKSHFEITALSSGPDDGSDLRNRIKSAAENFIDVRAMTDEQIAEFVHRHQIDIIVDLKGLTQHNHFQVFSRRVAPIQVNFLGYPGTMGTDRMDYIIADPTIIPEEHFPYYREKVVWLPDSYQANDDKMRISEIKPTRIERGLPERAFVFCCFNRPYKITPEIFSVWMRLLAATKSSVLWLIEANSTSMENLRREAERRAISPDRLIFAPRMPLAHHLARSSLADLVLDTMPINAHTTASDALQAGVPVLTCLGSTFAGRVAASLLKAVGLDELITSSLSDYEELALKLANDPSYLRALRERLARNRTTYPLFDTERFARHIEAAYTTMWERYQRGETPNAFAVTRIASLGQ
jgi:predicted O-linked N-acetylglucosamine transferase (SPINDLY family)